jgi:hypothetical protein
MGLQKEYFATGHCIGGSVFVNVLPSGRHDLNFLRDECHLHITERNVQACPARTVMRQMKDSFSF